MMRSALLFAVFSASIAAQIPPGPATSILVSGPKARLILGETSALTAVARDNSGQPRTGDTFTWSSADTNVLTVDSQGVVTAKALGFSEIRANIGNLRGAIYLQVLPSRIVVTPALKTLFVGERQQFRAAALDGKGAEIPNVTFAWDVVNATLRSTVVASVNPQGMLVAGGAGRFYVRARVTYPQQVFPMPFVPYMEGVADLDVRLLTSHNVRPSAATVVKEGRSVLRGRRSLLSVNEREQIVFQGSLDNQATAILMNDGGQLIPLAVTGSPGPVPFGFIYEFQNFSLNDSGQVLTRALVFGAPAGLLLASRGGARWLGSEGMYLGGIENISNFFVTRNSLNSSGDALIRATYRLTGEAAAITGLFRFNANGGIELTASTFDGLPGIAGPFTFDNEFGFANDGNLFFRVTAGADVAIYRRQGFDVPERLVSIGDSAGASRITGFPGSTYPTFLTTARGDLLLLANLSNNTTVLLHFPPLSKEPRILTFRSLSGVFAMRDENVLWYGDTGRGAGLQIWKGDGSVEAALAHGQDIAGEPVTQIDAAAFNSQGQVVSIARTQSKPFIVAKGVEILTQAGDVVETSTALSFTAFVGGGKVPGPAMLHGGGDPANILEVTGENVRSLVSYGDRFEGNVVSYGFFNAASRRSANGDLYLFLSPFGLNIPNFGVYRWTNGQLEQVLKFNFNWPDGTSQGTGSLHFAANNGELLLSGGTGRNHVRLYTYRDGQTKTIATNSGHPDYTTVLGSSGEVIGWNDAVMTESGRVLAHFRFRSTPNGLFIHENDTWTEAAVVGKTRLLDLPLTSINTIRAVNDSLYASFTLSGGGSALAEWQEGKWKILVSHQDSSPTGQPLAGIGNFDVNRRGEIVFHSISFAWPVLLLRRPAGELSVISYIFDPDAPTQIVRYVDIDLRDDGSLYFLALDLADRHLLFQATAR